MNEQFLLSGNEFSPAVIPRIPILQAHSSFSEIMMQPTLKLSKKFKWNMLWVKEWDEVLYSHTPRSLQVMNLNNTKMVVR